MLKRCKTCGEEKPLEEFYVNRSAADGLAYCCKDCSKAKAKRSYAKKTPEERRRSDQNWRRNNPAKAAAIRKRYTEKNRVKLNREATERRRRKGLGPRVLLSNEQKLARKRASARSFYYRNKSSQLANNRRLQARYRSDLGDNYIKKLLTGNSVLCFADLPQSLVEAHRALLAIKRRRREYDKAS